MSISFYLSWCMPRTPAFQPINPCPKRGEPGSAVEELVRVYDGLQHPNAVKWAKGTCVDVVVSSLCCCNCNGRVVPLAAHPITHTNQSPTNTSTDGRLALLTNTRVDIFEYPGEELDPYLRWTVPLHEERHWAQCSGTLAAQVGVW